jgi:hypothetical protein
MKLGEAFPGQYIKAADLQGKRVVVVIDKVTMEDIGGEQKPVMHFKGKDRGMVLNRTNGNAIADILGTDETDEWTGKAILLYPTRVDFQGKRVDAIRVDAPLPSQQQRPAPRAVEPEVVISDSDADMVPF